MRQKFDVGDLVAYGDRRGLVLERKTINRNHEAKEREMHVEEYTCMISFLDGPKEGPQWVRAKWLKHISKIM